MSLRHRVLPLAVAIAALAPAASAQAVDVRAADAVCPGAALAPTRTDLAQVDSATLCLINRERTQRGLVKLRANRRLDRSATRYSDAMAAGHFFSHVSPRGSTMMGRIKAVGYLSGARAYSVGENLAWGSGESATPAETVNSWMNSPGHRANILNGAYREIGVGVAPDAPVPMRGGQAVAATYTTHFGARS